MTSTFTRTRTEDADGVDVDVDVNRLLLVSLDLFAGTGRQSGVNLEPTAARAIAQALLEAADEAETRQLELDAVEAGVEVVAGD